MTLLSQTKFGISFLSRTTPPTGHSRVNLITRNKRARRSKRKIRRYLPRVTGNRKGFGMGIDGRNSWGNHIKL